MIAPTYSYTLVSDKSPRKDKRVGEPIVWHDSQPNPDEVVDAFVKRFFGCRDKSLSKPGG